MNQLAIDETIQFVHDQFMKYPHHSFGDGSVMYTHSKNVMDIALQLCDVDSDRTVVSIAALLHDIGKTFIASDDELHARHEDFNVKMSETLMDRLSITTGQRQQIIELISEKSHSRYSEIIRNADVVAFYTDKHLQELFIVWALKGNRTNSIHKKLANFGKLTLPDAKEMAKEGYEIMKSDWVHRGVSAESIAL